MTELLRSICITFSTFPWRRQLSYRLALAQGRKNVEPISQQKSYIPRKACGQGYILVHLSLENEICHNKKSKTTVLTCVCLLGRAYDKIEVTKASIGQKRSNEILATWNQLFSDANRIILLFLFEISSPHLCPTPLTLHQFLKFP